jgi:hypothetical protein
MVELEKLVAQQKEAGRKAAEEIEKTPEAVEKGRRAQEKPGAINVSVAVVPATASVDWSNHHSARRQGRVQR